MPVPNVRLWLATCATIAATACGGANSGPQGVPLTTSDGGATSSSGASSSDASSSGASSSGASSSGASSSGASSSGAASSGASSTSSSGGASSGGPAAKVPENLPAEIDSGAFVSWYTQAVCATSARCGLKFQGQPYSTADACVQQEVSHWAYHWSDWTGLLGDASAGVGWDPKSARACLESLFLWPCDRTVDLRTWPTHPCEEAFIGAVKVDQQCVHDAQCAAGFCDKSGQKDGCPGTCKTSKGVGEICGVGAQCKRGTWCRDGKCVQGPAGGGKVSDSCGTWPCAKHLWCSGSAEAHGKCLPYPAKGEDCGAKIGCVAGFRCDEEGSGKCVDGIAADKACVASGNMENHIETCGPGLICTPTVADYNAGEWTKGSCLKAQSAKDEWCDGVWQCGRTDLFCKPSKDGGYCSAMPGEGEPCEGSSPKGQCQPGLICPGANNCKKTPSLGDKCDINQNFCASPFICNGGTCAKVPKVGEKCLKDPKIDPCGLGAKCAGSTCVSTCK